MPLYKALRPVSYVNEDGQIEHIVHVGTIFLITENQAALISESDIEYVGSGSDSYHAPTATFLLFDDPATFPTVGSEFHVYLAKDTGTLFRWSEETRTYVNLDMTNVITATTAFLESLQLVPGATAGTVQWQADAALGPEFPGNTVLVEGIVDAGTVGKAVALAETQAEARTATGTVGRGDLMVYVKDFGAVGDGVVDDTTAINSALTYVGSNGGGVVLLMWQHLVSGVLSIPEATVLRGRGGNAVTNGTRITSSATSGAVVHIAARTSRLEHVRLLSTVGRRAAVTTTGHGVFIGGTDVPPALYPFFTRVGLFDVDIRDQPTDGVHAIGTLELGHLNTVTVSDCVRHGFVMDGGGIAGWTNPQLGPLMVTLTACRAIECGGQAFICLPTGGLAPQGLQLDFEAHGCAWDSAKRNTISGVGDTALHQIQIGGRGHTFHRLDVEDQRYAATATATGGHTRTALSSPSKGVYNLANGVIAHLPLFSSLAKSWTQGDTTSGLRIEYPTIFAGAYATAQAPAIQVPSSSSGVDIRYLTSMCTGASTVLTNQSVNANIQRDGVPIAGLASAAIPGWGDSLVPVAATVAASVLTTTSRRTEVGGEGAAADSLHTVRLATGLNGYKGMDLWLYRGAEDITVQHGAGNIRNASAADIVMTATQNTVLHYVFDGTNWVQDVDKNPSGSAILNFGPVSAQSFHDLTIPVPGAVTGDCVSLGTSLAPVTPGIAYTAWVSAADTVTVRAHNYTAGALDPSAGTFKAVIVR